MRMLKTKNRSLAHFWSHAQFPVMPVEVISVSVKSTSFFELSPFQRRSSLQPEHESVDPRTFERRIVM
ncbi:hypothetical protein BDV23DRAFT_98380 [Aspergillus alliaceus]|uniref:Uncharacterized protein n=1 Tax=Petromyces alliaceus TaxID=209559 RepID=A0A5N7C715_PETAA|nr:hypothetical protein BDV23DRAFT_98380 [Aspergillus alliaceus]